MNGEQGGDPAKLAQALLTITDQEQPPFRFIAGADAIAQAEEKLAERQQQIDAYRDLSVDARAGSGLMSQWAGSLASGLGQVVPRVIRWIDPDPHDPLRRRVDEAFLRRHPGGIRRVALAMSAAATPLLDRGQRREAFKRRLRARQGQPEPPFELVGLEAPLGVVAAENEVGEPVLSRHARRSPPCRRPRLL